MKYIHPSLEQEVPVELRREIYKKALEIKYLERGLCLQLPMLLWDLKSYLDTPKAFPELTEERLESIIGLDCSERSEIRRIVLKEMLEEIS